MCCTWPLETAYAWCMNCKSKLNSPISNLWVQLRPACFSRFIWISKFMAISHANYWLVLFISGNISFIIIIGFGIASFWTSMVRNTDQSFLLDDRTSDIWRMQQKYKFSTLQNSRALLVRQSLRHCISLSEVSVLFSRHFGANYSEVLAVKPKRWDCEDVGVSGGGKIVSPHYSFWEFFQEKNILSSMLCKRARSDYIRKGISLNTD